MTITDSVLTFSYGRFLKHILERVMYFKEGGAVGRIPAPALPHKLVDLGRTPRGALHPVTWLQQLVDISQLHPRVRRHPVGGDLPEQDPESPNVRLGRELVVSQALGCCPLNGELGARVGRVGVVPDETGQAEICDFDDVILAD